MEMEEELQIEAFVFLFGEQHWGGFEMYYVAQRALIGHKKREQIPGQRRFLVGKMSVYFCYLSKKLLIYTFEIFTLL